VVTVGQSSGATGASMFCIMCWIMFQPAGV
jgi:hypothetical protein